MAIDEEHDDSGKRRDGILRGRDIIPGGGNADSLTGGGGSCVPEFDLGKANMARHREATAGRRKRPGGKASAGEVGRRQDAGVEEVAIKESRSWSLEQNVIISEIVARDIERLCRGES